MTEMVELPCPRCNTILEVGEDQLAAAEGKVRCGNCLAVFDGRTGELDFEAPVIAAEENDPLADFTVEPMSLAELPEEPGPGPGLLPHAAIILMVILLGQLFLPPAETASTDINIAHLNVRPHPEFADALMLNAVLENPDPRSRVYPTLLVHFSNRYGERISEGLFGPQHYLHGELSGSEDFPANTRIQIAMDLADPGRDAVNYGVELHFLTELPN